MLCYPFLHVCGRRSVIGFCFFKGPFDIILCENDEKVQHICFAQQQIVEDWLRPPDNSFVGPLLSSPSVDGSDFLELKDLEEVSTLATRPPIPSDDVIYIARCWLKREYSNSPPWYFVEIGLVAPLPIMEDVLGCIELYLMQQQNVEPLQREVVKMSQGIGVTSFLRCLAYRLAQKDVIVYWTSTSIPQSLDSWSRIFCDVKRKRKSGIALIIDDTCPLSTIPCVQSMDVHLVIVRVTSTHSPVGAQGKFELHPSIYLPIDNPRIKCNILGASS